MPIVQMCCDESGKWSDSRWIVFGGLLAPPATWDLFVRAWRLLLKPYGIDFVHMSEAMQCNGAFGIFKGREPERDALLLQLAGEASRGITPVIALVPVPFKDKAIKPRQLDAFESALQVAFTQMLDGESLSLISDDEENMAPRMYELWRTFKSKRQNDRQKLAMIGFADDELYPPLQAADMWAYVCHQAKHGNSGPDDLFPKIQDAIIGHKNRERFIVELGVK